MKDFFVVYHQVYTVVAMVLFIGIWVWAWSSKRNRVFQEAAMLPLTDDLAETTSAPKENRHA